MVFVGYDGWGYVVVVASGGGGGDYRLWGMEGGWSVRTGLGWAVVAGMWWVGSGVSVEEERERGGGVGWWVVGVRGGNLCLWWGMWDGF